MTKIYLIRHGEAEGNIYRRTHGHYNGKITNNGKLQLAALRERFLNIGIDAVYASDLDRAVETAAAIAEPKHLIINKVPELREINTGDWEDVELGYNEVFSPELYDHFSNNPPLWKVPNAETFHEVQTRVVKAIMKIAEDNIGKTIAIVSHGIAIRTLIAYSRGIILDENCDLEAWTKVPYSDNTGVTEIQIDGGQIAVISYGDNSHLSGVLSTFAKQTWWRDLKAGARHHNLYYVPLQANEEGLRFLAEVYNDNSGLVSGDPKGTELNAFLDAQKKRIEMHPDRIVYAMHYGEVVGLVILDEGKNIGWIRLIYLTLEFRNKGFGVQLLGYAVSYFRRIGLGRIGLQVAEDNEIAIRFYNHYGFVKIHQDRWDNGHPYCTMEKDL